MAVLSPTVVGVAVAPFMGKLPCGFMRPSQHRCSDTTCPLNQCFVMAFDPQLARAIASCRRLWSLDKSIPMVYRRLRVLGNTLRIASGEFEEGVVAGDPSDWARLRSEVDEHEKPAVQLTTVGALLSFRDSPGAMWRAEGSLMLLPGGVELERPTLEHGSWWDADLPDPDSLIDDIDDPIDS